VTRKVKVQGGRILGKSFPSREEAIRGLLTRGWIDTFMFPGAPLKFVNKADKKRPPLAIQRIDRPRAGPIWKIVEYPTEIKRPENND
jgi:hypothetical protein